MRYNSKIKYIIRWVTFFLLILNSILAKNAGGKLTEISDYYLGKTPFDLKFSIKNIDDKGNVLSQMQGSFILKNTNSFKVIYPQEELLFDGEWLWSYNKNTNQVVVEEFEPTSSLNLIYDVINGKMDNYRIVKSETQDDYQKIFLKPEDDNNFFQQVNLTAVKDTGRIDHLKYVDFQNNQILIYFLQLSSTSIDDSSFYDIKNIKDQELIDLRP